MFIVGKYGNPDHRLLQKLITQLPSTEFKWCTYIKCTLWTELHANVIIIYLNTKSFATFTKMQVQNNSFGDNVIDKPRYFACINENQNGVACGCPASTRIVLQPPLCKVTRCNTLNFMQKRFDQYLFPITER